jgi:hypothetical protein
MFAQLAPARSSSGFEEKLITLWRLAGCLKEKPWATDFPFLRRFQILKEMLILIRSQVCSHGQTWQQLRVWWLLDASKIFTLHRDDCVQFRLLIDHVFSCYGFCIHMPTRRRVLSSWVLEEQQMAEWASYRSPPQGFKLLFGAYGHLTWTYRQQP